MPTTYTLTRWRTQYAAHHAISHHVERTGQPATTRHVAAVLAYSERQALTWLQRMESAGIIQRVGVRSGWIAPPVVQLPMIA